MTLSVKAAALSGFVQTLKALDAILDKAVDQAETRKIQPEVLLSARLAPDMLAFTRQIQLCCDFAKNAVARLSGGENPRFPDEEKSFAELKARIARTLDVHPSTVGRWFADAHQLDEPKQSRSAAVLEGATP